MLKGRARFVGGGAGGWEALTRHQRHGAGATGAHAAGQLDALRAVQGPGWRPVGTREAPREAWFALANSAWALALSPATFLSHSDRVRVRCPGSNPMTWPFTNSVGMWSEGIVGDASGPNTFGGGLQVP